MKHTLTILLQNEAGALVRVAGLFSARGHNIETLNVAPTDDTSVSRLTVTVYGDQARLTQILNQIGKLVDVLEIEHTTVDRVGNAA